MENGGGDTAVDSAALRLAEALVDFDARLTLDVLDHVQARANEWQDSSSARAAAASRVEQATRYRLLASMIEALTRVQILRDYH